MAETLDILFCDTAKDIHCAHRKTPTSLAGARAQAAAA